MGCFERVRRFLQDERGAITVDWVSLLAGTLLLGIAVVYVIFNSGVSPVVANVNSTLKATGTAVSTGPAPNISAPDGGTASKQ